jgi:hypothetical protein
VGKRANDLASFMAELRRRLHDGSLMGLRVCFEDGEEIPDLPW